RPTYAVGIANGTPFRGSFGGDSRQRIVSVQAYLGSLLHARAIGERIVAVACVQRQRAGAIRFVHLDNSVESIHPRLLLLSRCIDEKQRVAHAIDGGRAELRRTAPRARNGGAV